VGAAREVGVFGVPLREEVAAFMTETVLVIDDDPAMLDFLTQRLAAEGLTISIAGSGLHGINQAIDLDPDLILLDLRMPDPDGWAVCKMLRANPKTQHIPIIAVTGVLLPGQLEQAMASGADDIAFKPIDMADLLIRIRAMLRCRGIHGPIERRTRYMEIAREESAKSARPHPPASKE
jgi:two-component system cell cycle response regulator